MIVGDPRQRTRLQWGEHFGGEPEGVAFAPGRVNLIGEHVDYNGGLVLPMPIAPGTAIAWRPRGDHRVEVVALDDGARRDDVSLDDPAPLMPFDWRGYVRGMVAGMMARGMPLSGADLIVAGSLPRGCGLSSSTSLCVAIGRALSAATGVARPAPLDLALAAQHAEHAYAGVRCGIMDQLAVAAGTPGDALLIDCRDFATRTVALPAEWAVLVIQSGVARGLVDGHYNDRRAACETAAQALGVASLREADEAAILAAGLEPVVRRRALHVVREIGRTEAALAAISACDLRELGAIFAASHASLRDDFAVSVAPVDELVALVGTAIAERCGGHGGARMTGGGFGGAVVALVPAAAATSVAALIAERYRTPAGDAPAVLLEHCGAAGAI